MSSITPQAMPPTILALATMLSSAASRHPVAYNPLAVDGFMAQTLDWMPDLFTFAQKKIWRVTAYLSVLARVTTRLRNLGVQLGLVEVRIQIRVLAEAIVKPSPCNNIIHILRFF